MRIVSLHTELENPARLTRGWDVSPVDCDELEVLGGWMRTRSWSPCVWRDGVRTESNFLFADFLALDFDQGMPLAEALNIFCDSRHVIGLTKSHQKPKGDSPPCDRFRVVMPFAERIESLADYRYNVSRYLRMYDADEACKDGARPFFPCTQIVSTQLEGFEQDVYAAPPPAPLPDYSAHRQLGVLPRWCEGLLRFGAPDLRRNTTCFRLGLHLTLCGFSEAAIVDLIMASPIPIGPHVIGEVREAVQNGAKRAKEELSGGSAQEGKEDNAGAGGGGLDRSARR